MDISQILTISIPSIISIIGFWISIYSIKKMPKKSTKVRYQNLFLKKD